MPATGSSFFSFCWPAKTRLEEQAPDLVLVELNVNDSPDNAARRASGWLTRSILQLPNKPAVIFVGVFSLIHSATLDDAGVVHSAGLVQGGDFRMPLADFYDVTQISLRGPFLPPLLRNKTLVQPYFGTDLVHIAQPLHTAIGELVIAYLQEQRCEVLDELRYGEPADLLPGEGLLLDKVIPGEVPSHTLDQEILSEPVNPTAPPVCHLAGQTLQPLSPSPDWSVFLYQNEKTSLIAAEAGKAISFEVEVREGGAGEVGIAFLRSSNPEYNLGRLRCRVGGQEEALNGCWPSAISVFDVGIIAKNVKPDKHRVDCVTLAGAVPERNAYRIAAVMSR